MAEDTSGVEPPILLDNTVLSNLALVGEVGLVQRLWPRQACTTPQVLEEYSQGVESGWYLPAPGASFPS